MNPVSRSKFAKMIGVKPQYIPKIDTRLSWVKVKGKVKEQIDLHGADTLEYLKTREIDQSVTEEAEADEPEKTRPGLGNNPSGKSRSGTPANKGKRALEELKIQEQIEQLQIKNQQQRGYLIDKTLVKRVFGRMYSIDDNQFKTINVNVTPKISAAYNTANSSKAKTIIALVGEMFDLTKADKKELLSDINKTLEAGEPDRILEMNKILEDATGSILKNVQREIDDFLKLVEEDGQ